MDIRPFTGKRRLLTPPLIDADPANFTLRDLTNGPPSSPTHFSTAFDGRDPPQPPFGALKG
jgi:hypothetical protein